MVILSFASKKIMYQEAHASYTGGFNKQGEVGKGHA
jgi:hypothetical protein